MIDPNIIISCVTAITQLILALMMQHNTKITQETKQVTKETNSIITDAVITGKLNGNN